jgi:hypothetical protein
MTRTALLVRCNVGEADRIRFEAQKERRTISSYVSNISVHAVAADDRIFSKINSHPATELAGRRSSIARDQRTSILVRCSTIEAERIRGAAHRREIPINAFILQALKSAWNNPATLHLRGVGALSAATSDLGDL